MRPPTLTPHTHTHTHKGARALRARTKVPMGANPHGYLVFLLCEWFGCQQSLCVQIVETIIFIESVDSIQCEESIGFVESVKSWESTEPVESIES